MYRKKENETGYVDIIKIKELENQKEEDKNEVDTNRLFNTQNVNVYDKNKDVYEEHNIDKIQIKHKTQHENIKKNKNLWQRFKEWIEK